MERLQLGAPIQEQINTLTSNLRTITDAHDREIAALAATIRGATIEHGETVRGDRLWAIYNRGRTSWDTRSLDGYGAAHPEIMGFKRQGDPYVSITAAKGVK